VLNTLGLPASPIWLDSLLAYKFIIKNSVGVTQRTIDNITGIAPALPPSTDQWIIFSGTPTFLTSTSFSLLGDQTSIFQVARRVRTINTGGTVYSTILTSSFSGVTTVTLANDSGSLDSGLSQVAYGILSSVDDSIPAIIAKQSYLTFTGVGEITTAGSSPNFTAAPSPAIVSYATGQRFRVKFHAAGLVNPLTNYTLNLNGLGAKNLLAMNSAGGLFIPPVTVGTVYDVEYDGTQFIVLNPLAGAQRVGEFVFWPLNTLPGYLLLCNGAAVSRSTYARLFKVFGTVFGAGDGSTTFNLPNIAANYTLVNGAGGSQATSTVGQVIAHTHQQSTYQIGGSLGNGGSAPGSGPGADAPTGSTGGAANLAAGYRAQICVHF
jgi:hypothetical protein